MTSTTTDSVFFSAAYFYAEDRRLQDVAGSLYVGYPIYHKFQSTSNGRVRVNETTEYWKPYSKYEFREYTEGDEFVEQSAIEYVPQVPNQPLKKFYTTKFPTLTHRYWGGNLYICTARQEAFPITSDISNPYSYPFIQVWVESDETYENTYNNDGDLIRPTYWYHPFHNAFYTLDSITVADSFEKELLEANKFITSILNGTSSDFVDSGVDSRAVLSSIRKAQIDREMSKGRSRREATSFVISAIDRAITDSASKTSSKSNARKYNKKVIGDIFQSTNRANVRINAPGTVGAQSIATNIRSSEPELVQYIDSSVEPNRFKFLHKPNQIQYSNIGSEWSQIDRAANKPIVDWRGFKLMQLSFDFLVAPDEKGILDSRLDEKTINVSVDEKLRTLRTMAITPYPVLLQGFDAMTSEAIDFANLAAAGKIAFVITDFSVASIYRSATGAINRASCQMTLQEFPAELLPNVVFPKLKPPTPRPGTPGIPPVPPCTNLYSKTYTGARSATSQKVYVSVVDGKTVTRVAKWPTCGAEPIPSPGEAELSLGINLG